MVEDASVFFSSETYEDHVKDIVNENPSLFIFNNLLNVLEAEEGWDTLEATWKKLRRGDYLIISGLTPEHLEKYEFIKGNQVEGIVEFHNKKNEFYKSALSDDFSAYLTQRLTGSSLLTKEEFTFQVEALSANVVEIEGRRLLTFKKG